MFFVHGLIGQNYIRLFDGSSVEPSTYEYSQLEGAIQNVINALPEADRTKFKVYDFGFYYLSEGFVGGFDAIWDKVIVDVEAKPESDYYVIFGRESTHLGLNSKVRVELKLPNSPDFDCLTDTTRNNVEKYVQARANQSLTGVNVYTLESESLELLELYIKKIVDCDCSGVRNTCELSGDYKIIDPELTALGFRKKQITIGEECTWSNGNSGIYDYFGHQVIIDGTPYCITEQISEGKAIIEARTQVLPDTTIQTAIVGEVYILDNESFVNGEWEDALLRSTEMDYVEYWVIVQDNENDKTYLYSRFTLGALDIPLAFRDDKYTEYKSSVTLSPWGNALKLLGNAAIDACMQAIIIRLVDDDVKSKPSEPERWEEAFEKVSYLGAAWEGLSSLIPWKEDLVSTIIRTATSAFAVVLDKALSDSNYTINQGFIDFGIGFGASGLTQLITPKLGQFTGKLISNGLDSWYEKTSSMILKRIIFFCSKNFDNYTSSVVNYQKYIDQSDVINGVKKIDLMGGNKTQLKDDFINIDLRETIEIGIKGDATRLGSFIPHNSIDEIVTNNPYLGGAFSTEDYIKEVAKVLKSGKKIYINGTSSNPYFRDVTESLANQYGFSIEAFKTPLLSRFYGLKFFQTDLTTEIPITAMRSTVLVKI